MTSHKKTYVIIIIFLVVILGFFYTSKSRIPYQYTTGRVFGTIYHISYQSKSPLDQEIKQCFEAVDGSLSMFNPKSTIARINANDSTVVLDTFFINVITKAQEVYANTQGAFDITVAPLVDLWGFGLKNKQNVNDTLVQQALRLVGQHSIRLKGGKLIKDNTNTRLDASAIAKGYGCDVVAQMFERHQIQNYLVEIGGEIRLHGQNDQGHIWRVGIDRPDDDTTSSSEEIQQVVELNEGGMATSGNYRNFYIKDGKKYAHTIDPSTGYPIQHSLLSATILAPNCMTADAYATACMVLGVDDAVKLLEQHKELEGLFIVDRDGTNAVVMTSGFPTIEP